MADKNPRATRQAVLDSKAKGAGEADVALSTIADQLEYLQGWRGGSFLTDGDGDSGVLQVTKKEFRENIDAALTAVVKALGAVRVVKAVRKNLADKVRNMTDEEYNQ